MEISETTSQKTAESSVGAYRIVYGSYKNDSDAAPSVNANVTKSGYHVAYANLEKNGKYYFGVTESLQLEDITKIQNQILTDLAEILASYAVTTSNNV